MNKDFNDIKEFLNDNMSAFHRLYTRYERQLFFYINSMIRHKETSEDIFQEVWAIVIAKLPKFAFKGAFKNWLYTIAHNKVIDYARKAKHVNAVSLSDPFNEESNMTFEDIIADPAPDIIQQISSRELLEKVKNVVSVLPEEQKNVFLLRCDAGLKFKEIAEMTGESINTVLGRMHYAIKRIRNELQNYY